MNDDDLITDIGAMLFVAPDARKQNAASNERWNGSPQRASSVGKCSRLRAMTLGIAHQPAVRKLTEDDRARARMHRTLEKLAEGWQ